MTCELRIYPVGEGKCTNPFLVSSYIYFFLVVQLLVHERSINMTSTPRSIADEIINESWVELGHSEENSHARNTPVAVGAIYQTYMEKLLLEAQRESGHASVVESDGSSHRDSPRSSHSPIVDIGLGKDSSHLNKEIKDKQIITDWIWDWSSRPDQQPPKQWKFKHPQRSALSLRHSKIVKQGLFSKEVLSIFFLTNLLSLIIGAGLGLYVGKRFSNQSPSSNFVYMPMI